MALFRTKPFLLQSPFSCHKLVAFICAGPSVSTGKEQTEFLCQAIFQTYSWLESV